MAAANGLNRLIPYVYVALDVVSRELVGWIPSVTRDASVERAAVGQEVILQIAPAMNSVNITPGVTPPNVDGTNFGNLGLTITKSKGVQFVWNGEEERGLNNRGAGANNLQNDQIQQAIRTLTNEVEADIQAAARIAGSRATGTAGTTPFASGLGDTAQVRKILDDNGAPASNRSLIIDTTAGANMRTNTQLTKANEAGTTMTMRDGELLNLHGMSVKESAAVQPVAKGNGANYLVNSGGGLAVGTKTIPVDGGAGGINAGDIVTFAGDANKYVVTSALANGAFTIGGPGLRVAVADNATVTVGNNFTANVAFAKSAIVLAARQPALPKDGDMAADRTTIIDPRSGLAFELAMYKEYRQVMYEISLAWGVKGIKDEHVALLLG